MPIYSMTGFARVQVRVNDQLSYTLSLKSVNHRFLDAQLRMPNGLDALEVELRKALKDALVRGHVDLTLSVDRSTQQKAGYNRELVAGYVAAFTAARDEFGLTGEVDLNAILRLPGALQGDNRADDDLAILAESVRQQIAPLLDELKIMRAREGESLVQAALANLMQGRTVLVIAHRLSTIRRANRIAVLEDGRITAVGSHEELLVSSPTYQRLYQLQFRDMPETNGLDPLEVDPAQLQLTLSTGPEE